jgi:hypothetical protein
MTYDSGSAVEDFIRFIKLISEYGYLAGQWRDLSLLTSASSTWPLWRWQWEQFCILSYPNRIILAGYASNPQTLDWRTSCNYRKTFKGIVSWDFEDLFMLLSYSLYVYVPLDHIIFPKWARQSLSGKYHISPKQRPNSGHRYFFIIKF